MRVLGLKPGHDGAVALIEDGRLIFSLEAEKDSFPRHAELSVPVLAQALELADGPPDVVAIGGWHKFLPGHSSRIGAGYLGIDSAQVRSGRLFGRPVSWFSSSHERSHLFMVAAMGPDAPYEDCAILVWEGIIGALYRWQEGGAQISRTDVLREPGARYGSLFALGDPSFPDAGADPPEAAAGKLMALAAFADGPPTPAERATVDRLMALETLYPFEKAAFRDSPLHSCGVHTPALHRAAAYLSERIYECFRRAAERLMPRTIPLLIAGGCGLNCDWNRRWRESGLFTDVFVAPCANDSGSAIGSAVDAIVHHGAPCRLTWDVYAGAPFERDAAPPDDWTGRPLDPAALAARIGDGDIVAWVEGRYEIGPRALGHRSILASPLLEASRTCLNSIKGREEYRPIAPCCLAEELPRWFAPPLDDPYMLHFSTVTTKLLPAVTHVDGSARVQSLREEDAPRLVELMRAFRAVTGVGVLCNTSLNFRGAGLLNRASELFPFASGRGIGHIVVDGAWYTHEA